MAFSDSDIVVPVVGSLRFVAADGQAPKTLLAASGLYSRLSGLVVTMNEATARELYVYADVGGQARLLGVVAIPALAGNAGVPVVDGLTPLTMPQLGGVVVGPATSISVAVVGALTGGNVLDIFFAGGYV